MGDDDKVRDRWSKADIVAKIIGSVMLPLALTIVGYWITERQRTADTARIEQQRDADAKRLAEQHDADAKRLAAQAKTDEDQRNADRLTTLLKYLTSSAEPERYYGVIVVIALADQKKVPLELAQVVFSISKDDASARVRMASEEALARSVAADPETLLTAVQRIAGSSAQNAQALKSNKALDRTLATIAESGSEQQQSAAGVTLRAIHASAATLAECPASGGAEPRSPVAISNEIKRRQPSGEPRALTFADFQSLQAAADQLGVATGRGREWTAEDRQRLRGLILPGGARGEGDHVQIVGYVQSERASGPESVNCYLLGVASNDLKVNLTPAPGASPSEGISAELIPQNRPPGWSLAALRAMHGRLVKVAGQLFFDSAHRMGPGNPERMFWEIHPVTRFLVCSRSDNACKAEDDAGWVPLEQLSATSTN